MADPPIPPVPPTPADSPDSPSPLARAKPIFLAVRALAGPEREAELARLCAGDAELRRLVETLLDGERAPLPFETLADEIVAARDALSDPDGGATASTRIGHYRVLETLGEGGFGVVYLAEQEQPVRRRVALKVLKLGMDTRQIVARFEAERQALAIMDHPAIARVFDAGATRTGRPYFVMEFVRGEPITAYCDRRNLSVKARLELFRLVCDGVHHAHQKGVLHRDLKPGNILVADTGGVDGRPTPKIIDFGIAKALQDRFREHTLFTERGQLMGTPAYMSPEQALGDPDIDTRTDVFSLGVLLYELVTGETPIHAETLRSTPAAGIHRLLAETDAKPPSTRIRPDAAESRAIATARGTDPPRLRATLRRELDWIILKAIDRERHRRYGSAAELAADLQRYLAGDAVLAAPPSRWYALRKSARRNRATVIAASLVFTALTLGLIGTISQTLEARRKAAAEAERSAELAAVTEFQSKMLARIDASEVGAGLRKDLRDRLQGALARSSRPDVELSDFDAALEAINFTDAATDLVDRVLLQPAVAEIDEKFAAVPAVDGRLRNDVAFVYQSLGRWELAAQQFTRAAAALQAAHGELGEQALAARFQIAYTLKMQRRFSDAERELDALLPDLIKGLGPDHSITLEASTEQGNLYRQGGRIDDAVRIQRDTLERCRRALPKGDALTLTVMSNLALTLSGKGELDQAESLLREVYQHELATAGPDAFKTLAVAHNLGNILLRKNDLDGARVLLQHAVNGRTRLHGLGHARTANSAVVLARVLTLQRDDAAAQKLLEDLLAALPAGDSSLAYRVPALTQLALIHQRAARFASAESNLIEARALAEAAAEPTRPTDLLLETLYRDWHAADPASPAAARLAQLNARSATDPSRPTAPEPLRAHPPSP